MVMALLPTVHAVRPIAADDPRCNNGLRRKKFLRSRGNNSALPGV
jgi:hypothetical protein